MPSSASFFPPLASATALTPTEPALIPLGQERSLRVDRAGDSVTLQIRSGEAERSRALEIEVRFTEDGPTLRVRANKLELEAEGQIAARCESFVVDASERIELKSQGTILQEAAREARLAARRIELDAKPGAVCIQANDEVQLLGEQVLLNCDKPMPQPAWMQQYSPDGVPRTVPLGMHSGDADVIRALLGDE